MAESAIAGYLCRDLVNLVHSYVETAVEAIKRKDFETARYLFQREQRDFCSLDMATRFLEQLLKLEHEVPKAYFVWVIMAIVQICIRYNLSYCTIPFDTVAKFGRVDLFEMLLDMATKEERIKLCPSVNTLHEAIRHRHLALAKFIYNNHLVTSDGKQARLDLNSFYLAVDSDSVPMAEWIMTQICSMEFLKNSPLDMSEYWEIKSQAMLSYLHEITQKSERLLVEKISVAETIKNGDIALLMKAYGNDSSFSILSIDDKDGVLTECCLARTQESAPVDYAALAEECLNLGYHRTRLSIALLAALFDSHGDGTSLLINVMVSMKRSIHPVDIKLLFPSLEIIIKHGRADFLSFFQNYFGNFFQPYLHEVCRMAAKYGHLHLINDLYQSPQSGYALSRLMWHLIRFNRSEILLHLIKLDKRILQDISIVRDHVEVAFTWNSLETLDVLKQFIAPEIFDNFVTHALKSNYFEFSGIETRVLNWLYVHHRDAIARYIPELIAQKHSRLINWVVGTFGKQSLLDAIPKNDEIEFIVNIVDLLQFMWENNCLKNPTINYDYLNGFSYSMTMCYHRIRFESIQWLCNRMMHNCLGPADVLCLDGYNCVHAAHIGCQMYAFLAGFGKFQGLTTHPARFMSLKYEP